MARALDRTLQRIVAPRARWREIAAVTILAIILLGMSSSPGQLPEGALREARTALLEGRVDEALEELQRLAGEYEDSWFVALWLGRAWHAKGNLNAAASEYLRGLDLQSESVQLLIALGDIQSETNNLSQADSYFRQAIRAAPEYSLAYRKAAAASIDLEHHRAAIEFLERYIELEGENIELLNVLGMEQFLNEDQAGSVVTLEKVLQLDPDNARAHFGIGLALSDQQEGQGRAVVHLTRAVELDPLNPTAHYMLGRVLMAVGELELALPALERAVELSPDLSDAHYRLAQLYARMGDRESARVSQQRFMELNRQEETAEEQGKRLGILLTDATKALDRNDFATFDAAMAPLLERAPDDNQVRMLEIQGFLATGDYGAGLEATGALLAEFPDRWDPLFYQGILLYRVGRLEEARDTMWRVLEVNPLFEAAYSALGNILMALDDAEGAADAYLAAVRLDGENPARYLNLATAYEKLGLTELEAEAMAEYRRLLEQRKPPSAS